MDDVTTSEHLDGTTTDDWMHAHYDGELVCHVWECGDDCGCSQAQVTNIISRNQYGGVNEAKTVWMGKFRIDYEPGASHDLNVMARRLKKINPQLRRRIRWPWQVSA